MQPPFYYDSNKDKGIYDAMNKGISFSKGDWLFFLGAGDKLLENNTLYKVSICLSKKYDLIIGNIKYYSSDLTSPKKNLFISNFSKLLWIKSSAHHQSIFYKNNLFSSNIFNTNYKVLSDYDLNLKLLKDKVRVKKINICIANCDDSGISKQYNWSLYKEDIAVKTNNSSVFFKPLFYLIAVLKFSVKNIKFL